MSHLPWLLSALTICTMLMAGSRHPWTWRLGLLNQCLWLAWIIGTSVWGLLPMNLTLFAVFARNEYEWNWRKA